MAACGEGCAAVVRAAYARVVASDPGGVTAELGAELEQPSFAVALASAMEAGGMGIVHADGEAEGLVAEESDDSSDEESSDASNEAE